MTKKEFLYHSDVDLIDYTISETLSSKNERQNEVFLKIGNENELMYEVSLNKDQLIHLINEIDSYNIDEELSNEEN